MNEDEFSNLVNSKIPNLTAQKAAEPIIANIYQLFDDYVTKAHKVNPDSQNFVNVGSASNGLSTMLTVFSKALRYEFKDDKIVVYFDNQTINSYSFNGTTMISEKSKLPFSISDVKSNLDNFK